MAQYALYDIASGSVRQWQDTEKYSFAPTPDHMRLLPVDAAAWADQAGDWWVVDGALTRTDPHAPTAAQLLEWAQNTRVKALRTDYAAACAMPISFTSAAGVKDTYQCDPASVEAMKTYIAGGSVPKGFIWRSATNANNAFTYGDLTALVAAIAARNFANFQTLQSLIAKVRGSKKPASVSWPAS